jgi:hypothetical protein
MGVGLHRCPVVGKGWVRSLLVVVSQPSTDDLAGLRRVLEIVQEYLRERQRRSSPDCNRLTYNSPAVTSVIFPRSRPVVIPA